jgi:hypothetical protein
MRPPRVIGFIALLISILIAVGPANSASGASCASCPVAGVNPHDSTVLAPAQAKSTCSTGRGSNGYPIPDRECMTGAFDSTVPPSVFGSKKFTPSRVLKSGLSAATLQHKASESTAKSVYKW